MNYVAFYDLDGTIIKGNSGKVLIKHAYRTGLISKQYVLWGFYLSILYKLKLKDPVIIISTITKWLKGKDISAINDLTARIFTMYLIKLIRPEVVESISFHKGKGAKIVMLSSSIDPVCRRVADYLKMDDIICTLLETNNGILTGQPDGSFCFNEEKTERLFSYCEINNTSPDLAWYYGDSIADLHTLGVVGNPVCVYPDRRLGREAKKRGWKIISGL
jgi:HAD superfamily hydrolase (TIGR01490 family)